MLVFEELTGDHEAPDGILRSQVFCFLVKGEGHMD